MNNDLCGITTSDLQQIVLETGVNFEKNFVI